MAPLSTVTGGPHAEPASSSARANLTTPAALSTHATAGRPSAITRQDLTASPPAAPAGATVTACAPLPGTRRMPLHVRQNRRRRRGDIGESLNDPASNINA